MLSSKHPTRNSWLARIMCVIVASILWVYVMNEQNPITTRSFTVPLQTVHLQDDMLVKDLPETVNVRVSGTRSQIAALRTADVKAFIDLRGPAKDAIPTASRPKSRTARSSRSRRVCSSLKSIHRSQKR